MPRLTDASPPIAVAEVHLVAPSRDHLCRDGRGGVVVGAAAGVGSVPAVWQASMPEQPSAVLYTRGDLRQGVLCWVRLAAGTDSAGGGRLQVRPSAPQPSMPVVVGEGQLELSGRQVTGGGLIPIRLAVGPGESTVGRRQLSLDWSLEVGSEVHPLGRSEHVVYVALAEPSAPWQAMRVAPVCGAADGSEHPAPWREVLDAAVGWADGAVERCSAARAVTRGLFQAAGKRLHYLPNSAQHLATDGDQGQGVGLRLAELMAALGLVGDEDDPLSRPHPAYNCVDGSAALQAFTNAIGCRLVGKFLKPAAGKLQPGRVRGAGWSGFYPVSRAGVLNFHHVACIRHRRSSRLTDDDGEDLVFDVSFALDADNDPEPGSVTPRLADGIPLREWAEIALTDVADGRRTWSVALAGRHDLEPVRIVASYGAPVPHVWGGDPVAAVADFFTWVADQLATAPVRPSDLEQFRSELEEPLLLLFTLGWRVTRADFSPFQRKLFPFPDETRLCLARAASGGLADILVPMADARRMAVRFSVLPAESGADVAADEGHAIRAKIGREALEIPAELMQSYPGDAPGPRGGDQLLIADGVALGAIPARGERSDAADTLVAKSLDERDMVVVRRRPNTRWVTQVQFTGMTSPL